MTTRNKEQQQEEEIINNININSSSELFVVNTNDYDRGHIIINRMDDDAINDDSTLGNSTMTYQTYGELTHYAATNNTALESCQGYRNVMFVVDNVMDTFERMVEDYEWYRYLTNDLTKEEVQIDFVREEDDDDEEEEEGDGTTIDSYGETVQDTVTLEDDDHTVEQLPSPSLPSPPTTSQPTDRLTEEPIPKEVEEEERTLNTIETLVSSPYDERRDRGKDIQKYYDQNIPHDEETLQSIELAESSLTDVANPIIPQSKFTTMVMDHYIDSKFDVDYSPSDEEGEGEEAAAAATTRHLSTVLEDVEVTPDGSVLVGNTLEYYEGIHFVEEYSSSLQYESLKSDCSIDSTEEHNVNENDKFASECSNTSLSLTTIGPDEDETTTIIEHENEVEVRVEEQRSVPIMKRDSSSSRSRSSTTFKDIVNDASSLASGGLEMAFSPFQNLTGFDLSAGEKKESNGIKLTTTKQTSAAEKDSITVHTAETTKDGQHHNSIDSSSKKEEVDNAFVEKPKLVLRPSSPTPTETEEEEEAAKLGSVEVVGEKIRRTTINPIPKVLKKFMMSMKEIKLRKKIRKATTTTTKTKTKQPKNNADKKKTDVASKLASTILFRRRIRKKKTASSSSSSAAAAAAAAAASSSFPRTTKVVVT